MMLCAWVCPGGRVEGANPTLECGYLGGVLFIPSFNTWPTQLYAPTKWLSLKPFVLQIDLSFERREGDFKVISAVGGGLDPNSFLLAAH